MKTAKIYTVRAELLLKFQRFLWEKNFKTYFYLNKQNNSNKNNNNRKTNEITNACFAKTPINSGSNLEMNNISKKPSPNKSTTIVIYKSLNKKHK